MGPGLVFMLELHRAFNIFQVYQYFYNLQA